MVTEKECTHQIRMFGSFSVVYRGRPVPRQAWGRHKSLAIAKFLLAHRLEAVSIQRLADHFYPDSPPDRIQANLRGRISEIRRALWPDSSDPDHRDALRLVPGSGYRFDPQVPFWIDVEWFERHVELAADYFRREMWHVALEHFSRANALYRGDFLIDDADQRWTQPLRRRLSLAYRSSLLQTGECHLRLGQFHLAAACARRARTIDPSDGAACRLEIVALGHLQERAAAARVYHELVRALREMEKEPDPEITKLMRSILRGALHRTAPAPPSKHNLRQPLTPFFGREQELATLAQRLTDRRTRVVTLLGPGGVGKTRLAVEAGLSLVPQFRDGVFFVPVPQRSGPRALATAMAQAVGLSAGPPNRPVEDLIDYLTHHAMLIILDGAENSATETGVACAGLLEAVLRAPNVKLLVTSRRRLHLPGEHVVELAGLPLADEGHERDASPAYRLFVDRLTRMRPRFRPDDDEREAIRDICRMVKGMPLAIEIAASWGRVFTCGEIARRLASFQTPADALDELDDGMRLAFSFSWHMLSTAEQQAALRAATFAESFTLEAAERVTGSPASTLMSLCDKSFVHWESQGRLRLHEVIRSYLRRELSADPAQEAVAYREHARYFAHRLVRNVQPAGLQRDAIREIRDELADLQQAWHWWVANGDAGMLHETLSPLVYLHEILDRWPALCDLLQDAVERIKRRTLAGALDTTPGNAAQDGVRLSDISSTTYGALYAALLTHLGYVLMRMGLVEQAEAAVAEVAALMERFRAERGNPGRESPHRCECGVLRSRTEAMHLLVAG